MARALKRPDITVKMAVDAYRKYGGFHGAAKALGCSPHTIQVRLKGTDVDTSQARLSLPRDEIVRRYVDLRESARSIALSLGTTDTTIIKRLRSWGVPTRSQGEAARGVVPTGDPATKRCVKCDKARPLSAFHRDGGGHKGVKARCKACALDGFRKTKYGMKPGAFASMLKSQGGCCAICRVSVIVKRHGARAACVDHDHSTGAVRGILCRRCNSALGLFSDKVESLESAARYLKHHSG